MPGLEQIEPIEPELRDHARLNGARMHKLRFGDLAAFVDVVGHDPFGEGLPASKVSSLSWTTSAVILESLPEGPVRGPRSWSHWSHLTLNSRHG